LQVKSAGAATLSQDRWASDGLAGTACSVCAWRAAFAVRGYPFAAIKDFTCTLTARASKPS